MPRFAILEHDWPTRHWDFLLEAGAVLKSWRLLMEPCAGVDIPAEQNADHRTLYLDYEGPVSGGRGTVKRWDAGTFDWVVRDGLRIRIDGNILGGVVSLTSTAAGWVWRLDREVASV
jgi:hypothetical protein